MLQLYNFLKKNIIKSTKDLDTPLIHLSNSENIKGYIIGLTDDNEPAIINVEPIKGGVLNSSNSLSKVITNKILINKITDIGSTIEINRCHFKSINGSIYTVSKGHSIIQKKPVFQFFLDIEPAIGSGLMNYQHNIFNVKLISNFVVCLMTFKTIDNKVPFSRIMLLDNFGNFGGYCYYDCISGFLEQIDWHDGRKTYVIYKIIRKNNNEQYLSIRCNMLKLDGETVNFEQNVKINNNNLRLVYSCRLIEDKTKY